MGDAHSDQNVSRDFYEIRNKVDTAAREFDGFRNSVNPQEAMRVKREHGPELATEAVLKAAQKQIKALDEKYHSSKEAGERAKMQAIDKQRTAAMDRVRRKYYEEKKKRAS